jgi:Na+-transporting NADH:ubiquinone oxidoreductase subunit F
MLEIILGIIIFTGFVIALVFVIIGAKNSSPIEIHILQS